jgi:hypothetical protein
MNRSQQLAMHNDIIGHFAEIKTTVLRRRTFVITEFDTVVNQKTHQSSPVPRRGPFAYPLRFHRLTIDNLCIPLSHHPSSNRSTKRIYGVGDQSRLMLGLVNRCLPLQILERPQVTLGHVEATMPLGQQTQKDQINRVECEIDPR